MFVLLASTKKSIKLIAEGLRKNTENTWMRIGLFSLFIMGGQKYPPPN
jgi:hypothetical protein